MSDVKEIAKTVRKELRQAFPECKFSVMIERFAGGQAMTVALMRAPSFPFANLRTTNGYTHSGCYAQLNHYHITEEPDGWICNGYYLTETAAGMLKQVVEIANRKNWNMSDSQIDHFDVNYWFHLAIGKWDKPFIAG